MRSENPKKRTLRKSIFIEVRRTWDYYHYYQYDDDDDDDYEKEKIKNKDEFSPVGDSLKVDSMELATQCSWMNKPVK